MERKESNQKSAQRMIYPSVFNTGGIYFKEEIVVSLWKVGEYVEKFNELTKQNLPCGEIFQSSGLIAHVKKRHPKDVHLVSSIPLVISSPDYVGKNPKENSSIELVKVLSDNVMVCVKLDDKKGILYVASVYTLSAGKINNRLNSGRLKKFDIDESK